MASNSYYSDVAGYSSVSSGRWMAGNDTWVQQLAELAHRLQGLGVVPDLASLSPCELWGLYIYLRHIAEE